MCKCCFNSFKQVWNIFWTWCSDEDGGNVEELFKMCATMYEQVLNRIYTFGSGGQNKNFKSSLKCVEILLNLNLNTAWEFKKYLYQRFPKFQTRSKFFSRVWPHLEPHVTLFSASFKLWGVLDMFWTAFPGVMNRLWTEKGFYTGFTQILHIGGTAQSP